MKKLYTIFILISLLPVFTFAQEEFPVSNKNQLINNTVYSNAPEEAKHSAAFVRQWQFFEQRAYPNSTIPENAYQNSIIQRNAMESGDNLINNEIAWVSIGPSPGAYFNYGNISSRIVTGAYDPSNPNVIYIGAANGGVWKTTDSGISWNPLTDNQVSMAMGAIAIDPQNTNIIYAGTGEATYSGASYFGFGLLKSTDAGGSWQHITSGLPSHTYFSRIKIRPGHSNEVLAAMGNSGLYYSSNSGINWSLKWSGKCDDIVFTPSGDTVFAIGGGSGMVRSTDGGANFTSFGTGLISGQRIHFDLCKADPSVMYAAIYNGDVSVYKSTNYGTNWTQAAPSQDFNGGQAWYDLYCRVSPFNPNNVFVGTIDVYRSTDGGANFTNITYGYSNGPVHVDQHYLFFHPTNPNTFYVCDDGGIYKSTDNGNSFINMNQDLTLTQFYRIKASPFLPGRILGGTQDNGTQETNSTLNWAAAFGGDGGEVSFNPINQNYIIGESQNGGLTRTINNGASWSYNATSGIDGSENVAWVAPIVVHPDSSGIFYVARQKVYKTTNNGANWVGISDYLNGGTAVMELAISKTNPATMYATSNNKVFRSDDRGYNWTNVTSGLPNKTITSVYVDPLDYQTAYLTFSGYGTSKVYKSTDNGNHWVDISGNLPDSPANDIFVYKDDIAHPNTYFVAMDIGVFMTQDDGQNWIELDNGIPNTVIMHLDYSPTTKMLRAGTHGRGVYEAFIDFSTPVELNSFNASVNQKNTVNLNWSTASETNNHGFEIQRKLKKMDWTTIGFVEGNGTSSQPHNYSYKDDINNLKYDGRILYRLKQIDFNGASKNSKYVYVDVNYIPDEIALYQNYPNPFNPTTTITYSVSEESVVNLTIYNSLGQKVAELVNGIQNQGMHQVIWDAENMASGIYFYSLNVKDKNGISKFNQMKKLILMK